MQRSKALQERNLRQRKFSNPLAVSDSIVDDVIAEFAPDENDREKRRRVNLSNFSVNKMNNVPAANLGALSVKIEKPFASSVNADDRNVFNESSNNYGDVNVGPQEGCLEQVEDVKSDANILPLTEDNSSTLLQNKEYQSTSSEEKLDFEVESDGSLLFYILDAYEEIYGANAGNLYLFGKVKSGGTYHSCCVVVKNMQRCVYAIPTVSFLHHDTIQEVEKKIEESRMALIAAKDQLVKQGRDVEKFQTPSTDLKDMVNKLQKDVEESQTALRNRLHELASDMKTEIAKELLERNVSSFSMAPVKRNYAFERSDIPHGENYVLKINYPFKDQPLPLDLKGNNFCALLGTHSSCLELFLIKRKIKGPSWLSISKFSTCAAAQRVSWCKFEVTVDFAKDIQTSSKNDLEIPPVVVAAINLKTIINEKQNVNEIVAASVICCHNANVTPQFSNKNKNGFTARL